MLSNISQYIGIILFSLILRVLTLFVYPISFIFRSQIIGYCNKRFFEAPVRIFVMRKGYARWKLYFHPYFWLFCFTCNGLSKNFSGPSWFMYNKKVKWFPDCKEEFDVHEEYGEYLDYGSYDFWPENIRYFWICYRWNALRNPAWAFSEWFFREGKWKEGTEKVKYCYPLKGSIYKYWDITPQLKWDKGNDGGKVLRFQTPETPVNEIWLCTHEGKKLITFTTHKGNKRFMYCFCKIVPFFKKQLIIEHHFGWNWWNGIPILHFKHILR